MGRKRASQIDETGQRINCKVCGSSAVGRRCGAVVCEACKKFFIRNRNSLPKLRCVNESSHNAAGTSGSGEQPLSSCEDNTIVRQICEITPNNRCCSRCRIIKCLELGMRMKGKKTKASMAAAMNAAAPSPGFSIASPMSNISMLKDHGASMSSMPPTTSAGTPSTSDPTVDMYIPKKQRAAMNVKQQSPFNPTSSESLSPPWFASPSPPLPMGGQPSPFSGGATSSRGQQQDQFGSNQRSLPVFPSAVAETFRTVFPSMPSTSTSNHLINDPNRVTISPDNEQARSSQSVIFNGFLAYQKFARDLQARNSNNLNNNNNNNNQANSPTSSNNPFSPGGSQQHFVPPTSASSFLTASAATTASSPISPSSQPGSPSWAYLATALLRGGVPSASTSNTQQQQTAKREIESPMESDQPARLPPIADEPPNLEAMANEAMLRGIVRAYPSLQLSSKQVQLDMVNGGQHVPTPAQMWQSLMGNFEDGVGMGLSYVKSLPGIRQINVKDRSEIFCDSFLPMAAAQQLLDAPPSRPDGFFLNMTQDTRNLFLSYFPAYTALAREVHDIGDALSNWNPSFIEFVFLEAMLFYRADVPNLQNPLAVGRLRNRLTRTLEAYLQKTCRTEDEAQGAMRQFYAVYNLLMRLPDVHNAVLSQTAREHPEIFGVSALLGELYSRESAADQTNTGSSSPTGDNVGTETGCGTSLEGPPRVDPIRSASSTGPVNPTSQFQTPGNQPVSNMSPTVVSNQSVNSEAANNGLHAFFIHQQNQALQRLPTPLSSGPPPQPPPQPAQPPHQQQMPSPSSSSLHQLQNHQQFGPSPHQNPNFIAQQQQSYEQQLLFLRQHLQQSSPMHHYAQHSTPIAKPG